MLFEKVSGKDIEKPLFYPYTVSLPNEKTIHTWIKAYRIKTSYEDAASAVVHQSNLNLYTTKAYLIIKRVRVIANGTIQFFNPQNATFEKEMNLNDFTKLCFS
jgi:hypothetical protein